VKPFDDSNGWNDNSTTGDHQYTAPASAEAKEWDGFNSALKPAYEPIVIAQKPVEKTIVDNVLKYGTGAFNVDACRVPTENPPKPCIGKGFRSIDERNEELGYRPNSYSPDKTEYTPSQQGRYPANLVHDGSPEVLALFPNTGKSRGGGGVKRVGAHVYDGGYKGREYDTVGFMDSGSAARFFYCAKPSRKERGEGNNHPTLKAIALMRWLVRLVTRRGGLVLDPFMGSGTTGIAALQEGMRFVGIERDAGYMEIAKRRIMEAAAEIEKALEKERHEFIQQELPL
jgi:site-specific DNA-methyltransferase (adenine-specific)